MVSQMQPQPHTVKQKHEDTPKETFSTEPRAALIPLTAPWDLQLPTPQDQSQCPKQLERETTKRATTSHGSVSR